MNSRLDNAEKKKVKEFQLVFPVNIQFQVEDYQRKYAFRKKQVQLINYAKFYKRCFKQIPQPKRKLLTFDFRRTAFSRSIFLVVESRGRDYAFAMEEAFTTAMNLVSLIIFVSLQGRYTLLSTTETAMSGIEMPRVFVFDNKGQFITTRYSRLDFPKKLVDLDKRIYSQLIKFYNILEGIPANSKVRSLILNALGIYTSAVTDKTWAFSFLKLWMGLELMTLNPMRDKTTIKRIKSILIKKPPFFDARLDSILHKRNSLVHNATFDEIYLEDRNFVKLIFEDVLWSLIYLGRQFKKNREIETIYENVAKSVTELKEKVGVLEFLLKEKIE